MNVAINSALISACIRITAHSVSLQVDEITTTAIGAINADLRRIVGPRDYLFWVQSYPEG
jgi:hypothetical protein